MSKKLKNEEIRTRIIGIFRESGSFFQLKEIETAGKSKGLQQRDIKPFVQSLVEEDVIKTCKIGTSSYYWIESLQKNINAKIQQLDKLKSRNKELHEKLEALDAQVEQMNNEIKEEDEFDKCKRAKLMEDIKSLKAKEKELTDGINRIKNLKKTGDAKSFKDKIKPLSEAANRWTDNIFTALEWSKKKFNLEDTKALNKECKIPEELDYLATD